MRLKNNKKLSGTILLVAMFLFLLLHLQNLSIERIVENTPATIPLAAISFLLLYGAKAVVMVIPITILYISAGMVFPTVWAIPITYLGLVVALSVGYINGKRLGEEKVNQMLANHPKISKSLTDRSDNLSSLCFTARILPTPFDLFSMFCGAIGMPFKKYLFISLLGLSPKAIPFVLGGNSISNLQSAEFLLPFVISFVVIMVIFILYRRLNGKVKEIEEYIT